MKANATLLPARFEPETRFEVPVPTVPFRRREESRLESLKNRLLTDRLGDLWAPEENSLLRRAANEAASLAWVTPYPMLVFPVLFEEKAESALARLERQQQVLRRSRELLAV